VLPFCDFLLLWNEYLSNVSLQSSRVGKDARNASAITPACQYVQIPLNQESNDQTFTAGIRLNKKKKISSS
jgi:hypothetical protein